MDVKAIYRQVLHHY